MARPASCQRIIPMLSIYNRITHAYQNVNNRAEACAVVGSSLKNMNKMFGMFRFYKSTHFIVTDDRIPMKERLTLTEILELFPDTVQLIHCRPPVPGTDVVECRGREPLAQFLGVHPTQTRHGVLKLPVYVNGYVCWDPTRTLYEDLNIDTLPSVTIEKNV